MTDRTVAVLFLAAFACGTVTGFALAYLVGVVG
jgi:preprotein translocase subunit SecD